ncbi:MAG: RDD family protein [Actinomycetota bacterium]
MKACPYCGALNPDDAEFCSGCGSSLGAGPPGGQPYAPYQQYQYHYPVVPHYAGFWIRFVAALVDGIILLAAMIPLNIIFWAVNENFYVWGSWDVRNGVGIGLVWLFNLIRLVVVWTYYTLMTGRYQATLGKMLVKIKVVGPYLGPITYGTAALREILGKFVSAIICYIGYIWAGFDERKQAWHDKIANTYVIYEE